jgi:putative zinc finger/helix-turn-helix YgiT family protein
MTTQTAPQARKAVDLAGTQHDCGGRFQLIEEKRDILIGQARVPVTQQFFRCNECGEVRQTLDQLGAARRAAALELRRIEGLLSGAEIRRIREERLQVTQGKLEKALGLGAKTVVRWETDRVLQPKATDNLLRLLDRDPSALKFLADQHGVDLPTPVDRGEGAEQVEAECAPTCSVPIPRTYLAEIHSAAQAQGIPPESYVVWLLAERLTALRTEAQLEKRFVAMQRELAGRIERTMWKNTTFAWPAQQPREPQGQRPTPSPQTTNLRYTKGYAQSA